MPDARARRAVDHPLMRHVVFIAPYFGANIMSCLGALAGLEGVKLGIITHEVEARVPSSIRPRLSGHYRVTNTLDPAQLIEATRAFQKEWGHVDRLLGYMEEMQLPVARAREALGIPGMDVATATNFRDKNRMKETLARAGLPVARQALVTEAADALALVDAVGYPLVLKPLAGVGTRDTMRVSNDEDLYSALERLLPSKERPVQAEEFVQGDEFTLETISIGGQPVWHSSTYYLPGPLKVVENAWMQYCVLLPREALPPHAEGFRPTNAAALSALGMQTGLSHMEWFQKPDGQAVISEVAARPPGVNIMTMIGLAHGVDMWERWARLMVFEEFEIPERRFACGSAFFRGHGPGRTVSAVEGLEAVIAELGDVVVSGNLPKVGQPRSSHYEGEGWVVVRHPDTAGVLDALRKLVTRTTIRYR
jgi:hypothetical protein